MGLFAKGDLVTSRTDEQGLVKGRTYAVTDVVSGKFGVVYYELDKMTNLIVNGHFLLEEFVPQSRPETT